jgi:hypothetical protein
MAVKTIRVAAFCFGALLLAAPILSAQDFSKYRNFSLGMSLGTALKYTAQKPADVKTTHSRPALIQELTWWPPNLPGASHQSDSVQEMLFSFCNGELYKISVIYDRASTQGLTAEDMLKSLSVKYGTATNIALETVSTRNEQYEAKRKPIASWEDANSSFNLVRSSFSGGFELVIYSQKGNAEAELALVEAVKLEKQEEPQKAAERQKKETDDLEAARQKNKKVFQP